MLQWKSRQSFKVINICVWNYADLPPFWGGVVRSTCVLEVAVQDNSGDDVSLFTCKIIAVIEFSFSFWLFTRYSVFAQNWTFSLIHWLHEKKKFEGRRCYKQHS